MESLPRSRASTVVTVAVAILVVALVWLALCDKRWTAESTSFSDPTSTVDLT